MLNDWKILGGGGRGKKTTGRREELKIRGSLWAFGMQVSGRLQPGSLNA